eukprot:437918-Hanusia_phi.AAC.1
MFIPVILEEFETRKGIKFPQNPKAWYGPVGAEIGKRKMFLDFIDDIKFDLNVDNLDTALKELIP